MSNDDHNDMNDQSEDELDMYADAVSVLSVPKTPINAYQHKDDANTTSNPTAFDSVTILFEEEEMQEPDYKTVFNEEYQDVNANVTNTNALFFNNNNSLRLDSPTSQLSTEESYFVTSVVKEQHKHDNVQTQVSSRHSRTRSDASTISQTETMRRVMVTLRRGETIRSHGPLGSLARSNHSMAGSDATTLTNNMSILENIVYDFDFKNSNNTSPSLQKQKVKDNISTANLTGTDIEQSFQTPANIKKPLTTRQRRIRICCAATCLVLVILFAILIPVTIKIILPKMISDAFAKGLGGSVELDALEFVEWGEFDPAMRKTSSGNDKANFGGNGWADTSTSPNGGYDSADGGSGDGSYKAPVVGRGNGRYAGAAVRLRLRETGVVVPLSLRVDILGPTKWDFLVAGWNDFEMKNGEMADDSLQKRQVKEQGVGINAASQKQAFQADPTSTKTPKYTPQPSPDTMDTWFTFFSLHASNAITIINTVLTVDEQRLVLELPEQPDAGMRIFKGLSQVIATGEAGYAPLVRVVSTPDFLLAGFLKIPSVPLELKLDFGNILVGAGVVLPKLMNFTKPANTSSTSGNVNHRRTDQTDEGIYGPLSLPFSGTQLPLTGLGLGSSSGLPFGLGLPLNGTLPFINNSTISYVMMISSPFTSSNPVSPPGSPLTPIDLGSKLISKATNGLINGVKFLLSSDMNIPFGKTRGPPIALNVTNISCAASLLQTSGVSLPSGWLRRRDIGNVGLKLVGSSFLDLVVSRVSMMPSATHMRLPMQVTADFTKLLGSLASAVGWNPDGSDGANSALISTNEMITDASDSDGASSTQPLGNIPGLGSKTPFAGALQTLNDLVTGLFHKGVLHVGECGWKDAMGNQIPWVDETFGEIFAEMPISTVVQGLFKSGGNQGQLVKPTFGIKPSSQIDRERQKQNPKASSTTVASGGAGGNNEGEVVGGFDDIESGGAVGVTPGGSNQGLADLASSLAPQAIDAIEKMAALTTAISAWVADGLNVLVQGKVGN
ncbi:hypothetical protein HDU76_013866 [Blyttiomyces sp. JEL0837]|nr:hypothetical protein HDU76_013866 [Blyttiomyces sp. JEL0837]